MSALLRDLARAPEVDTWQQSLRVGSTVGRFEIVRELGRGGFGVVYEARDRDLGRAVAFKAVRASSNAAVREERLLCEAETAARLSHPNIVQLYDVGRCEHGPYLVLELLRGRTLQARLDEGPVSAAEALRIACEIARGLAHAHATGVVHRDLKPANVFLCDDGQVKVLDFGLAHAFGRRRAEGGTPEYMAPEQRRGAPEDERTDVFALGVILSRMLTGSSPFAAGSAAQGRRHVPAVEIDSAPAIGPLLARMLDEDPVRRPRDAGEVVPVIAASIRALEAVQSGATVPVRTRRRRRWRAIVGAAVGLAAIAALAIAARRSTPVAPRPVDKDASAIVAVVDVANTTGERDLDALSALLVTSLEQSQRLSVIPLPRMRHVAREAGHEIADQLDHGIVAELGRRAGANVVVMPSVHRVGSAYAVDVRGVDAAKGVRLFTVAERVRAKDELLAAMDAISDGVRRELGEGSTEVVRRRVRVGEAVTRDLEAYRHYQRGIELRVRACDIPGAEREQRRALELDPDFAAAHMELGTALVNLYGSQQHPEAVAHFRAAYALSDRMPDKERMIVQLDRFITIGQMEETERRARSAEATRLAEGLVARYPYDAFGLYYAGMLHAHLGTSARAIELLQRSLRLDPGQCWVVMRLFELLRATGRTGEALEAARAAAVANPAPWNARYLTWALLWTGAQGEASSYAREALRTDPHTPGLACVLAATGEVVEAEAALRRMASTAPVEWTRAIAQRAAVVMAAHQGRVTPARTEWEATMKSPSPWTRREAALTAAHLSAVGFGIRAPPAVAALRDVQPSFETAAWLSAYGAPDVAAKIAEELPAGDPAESLYVAAHRAARRAPEAADTLRSVSTGFSEGDNWLRRVLLAETLLEQSRAAEAVEALRDLESAANFCTAASAALYPRALLVRARALESIQRRDEARFQVETLLSRLKHADPGLPILREARSLRQRLTLASEGTAPRTP